MHMLSLTAHAPQQALVTSIALISESRFRCGFKPTIEKFPQRNLGSLEAAAQVAFAQNFRQILLGSSSSAVDSAVVVPAPTGLAIAAEEDAD